MQVSSADFAISSDGSLVSRSGGNVTMLDVLTDLDAMQASNNTGLRRRSLLACGGNIFDNNCQDNNYVAAWQTRMGVTVSPSICYWRTYEFKRRDGACYNWVASAKTWTNTMGVVGTSGLYQTFNFQISSISSSSTNPGIYFTPLGQACVYYTVNLVPSTAGSGSITVYLFCNPPETPAGGWTGQTQNVYPCSTAPFSSSKPPTCCTGCVVNYIDYTNFIPGTVVGQSATNPCFSSQYSASGAIGGSPTSVSAPYPSGPYYGATSYTMQNARPTGTIGCHEYFLVYQGTNADPGYTTAASDVGSIPSTGPYLPVPPQPSGGRHLLLTGGGGGSNANPSTSR